MFNWHYRFFRELSAFYQWGDNMYVIITKLFFLVRLEREAMMFWEFRGNEHLTGTFFHPHQYVHDSRVRINNLPNLLHTCMRANHSHKILYFLKLVFIITQWGQWFSGQTFLECMRETQYTNSPQTLTIMQSFIVQCMFYDNWHNTCSSFTLHRE